MLLKLKFSRGDQLINIQLYNCVIVLIYLCIIVISTITYIYYIIQIIFLKHLTFMDHAWSYFFKKNGIQIKDEKLHPSGSLDLVIARVS